MNTNDPSTPPPITAIPSNPETYPGPEKPKPSKPLQWWLRKLFACNPFYLVSAALLLYGCYRVSMDAPFLSQESARLLFNFSAVQFYEILLVLTAIFLARRSIWYDSTLLVGLENLLIFVPFILVSQAAFIDSKMAQTMSLTGAALAMIRFGALKRFFTRLNLPGRLLGTGFILLALNVALPLLYRHFGETKIGVHIDSGPAYKMNECTWLLILPAMLALANFLPRTVEAGTLLPQHRWLPAGLFSLWAIATGIHVYSLDYIYQFDLRCELIAPLGWVLAWTAWLRLAGSSMAWTKQLKYALMSLLLLVPLLALAPGDHRTFLVLVALNIVAYLGVCTVERSNRVAKHLLFASMLMFIAGLPEESLQFIVPRLGRTGCVAVGALTYLIFLIVRSRNPKLAVLGSIMLAWAIAAALPNHANAIFWAAQGGLVFLLLHSLLWNDPFHTGAKAVRMLVALAWVMQSLVWMDVGPGRFWMPCVTGTVVLTIYVCAQIRSRKWDLPVIPGAAILAMISGPGANAVENVRTMPLGLLAVIGSFLLFGVGTVAALTRTYWHKPEPSGDTASTSEPNPNSQIPH